jgi:hypothetical protein
MGLYCVMAYYKHIGNRGLTSPEKLPFRAKKYTSSKTIEF